MSINHMALTDVIFILLIFFISLSQLRTSNLDLDLPEVATDQEEQPADDAPPAVVELAKDGRVLLDGRELEVEAIVADLVERRERTGVEPRVRVRGDQEGNYGKFVEVMAALADAKLGQIEIAVQSTR